MRAPRRWGRSFELTSFEGREQPLLWEALLAAVFCSGVFKSEHLSYHHFSSLLWSRANFLRSDSASTEPLFLATAVPSSISTSRPRSLPSSQLSRPPCPLKTPDSRPSIRIPVSDVPRRRLSRSSSTTGSRASLTREESLRRRRVLERKVSSISSLSLFLDRLSPSRL